MVFYKVFSNIFFAVMMLSLPSIVMSDDFQAEKSWEEHAHSPHKNPIIKLKNKHAIETVIAKYARAWDGKDLEGLIALFDEKALWEQYLHGLSEPVFTAAGLLEIYQMAYFSFEFNVKNISTRHNQSNIVFEKLTQKKAKTETTVLITHQGEIDMTPRVVLQGRYLDDWKKTSHGWKIVHRRFMNDKRPSAPQP